MKVRKLAALAAVAMAAAGSCAQAAGWHASRTADGAPSLDGMWSNASLTDFERPKAFKSLVVPVSEARAWEKTHLGQPPEIPGDSVGGAQSEWWETGAGLARIRGQVRTSWIVAPADGQFPLTAAAKAAKKARHDRRMKGFDNPEELQLSERCLATDAAGPPLANGGYNDNYAFVQTKTQLAIMTEFMHDVRVIRIGASEHHPPASVRSWLGDSVGHWEGDTLVVETTNFAAPVISPDPVPDGADMKVIERFTRTGADEITYEFAVTDPYQFTQTWRGEMVFHTSKGPIYEYACHEGNYSAVDMLQASRRAAAPTPASPPAK